MKSISNIIGAVALLLTSTAAFAAVPENIYPIGSATEAVWNTGAVVAMQREGNVFTWEGTLKGGTAEDDGQLKFITDHKYECPTFHSTETYYNVPETGINDAKMLYYEGGADNKWKIQTTGYYKITLTVAEDPNAENGGTISIVPAQEPIVPANVYLIGSATAAGQEGWDTAQAVSMTKDGNVFTWTGPLAGGNGNELKFLTARNFEDKNFYAPENGVKVTAAGIQNQTVNNGPNDNKWVIEQTGIYTIKLTVNENGTTDNAGTIDITYVEYPQVYMLGLAADQFNSVDALQMTASENGEYKWNGTLDYAKTDGDSGHANKQFKFCMPRGEWNQVLYLIPSTATGAGVTPITEGTYDLKYSYEFGGKDNKVADAFFGVNEGTNGSYTITVNPQTLKMTLAKNNNTGIEGVSEETAVEEIFTLDGRRLQSLDNAAAGIYVVRAGKNVKKVAVK